jgi:urease accessory protein
MRRAEKYYHPGHWTGAAVATLTLPYADRHRRRILLKDDSGEPFLLDLPHATRLDHGGGLEVEPGRFIKVCAAIEDVTDICCQSAVHTAQVAWHIGNRHAPLQVLEDGRLRIVSDHVLGQMLEGLGAHLQAARAPFAPEGGAYKNGHQYEHSH